MLGDERRHAVIDEKIDVPLLVTRDGVCQQHGQILRERLRDRQAARLGNDAVGRTHHHLNVVHKAIGADDAVSVIACGEFFNVHLHFLVVAADDEHLERHTDLHDLFDSLYVLCVSHAAAHQQDGMHIRVDAELLRRRTAVEALVELRMHRNAERQDALTRHAALHAAVGQQLARRDDILHARHILPVRMERVVRDDADGHDVRELFPLFQLIHHLRGENMRADDDVRLAVGNDAREFGRAEGIDDIDDARCRGEIARAVVLCQLIDQTVQRLHMLGGEQISLVDRGFNEVADIGVHIERVHLRPLVL